MLLADHLHETNLHVPHLAATIYVTALRFYIHMCEMCWDVLAAVSKATRTIALCSSWATSPNKWSIAPCVLSHSTYILVMFSLVRVPQRVGCHGEPWQKFPASLQSATAVAFSIEECREPIKIIQGLSLARAQRLVLISHCVFFRHMKLANQMNFT